MCGASETISVSTSSGFRARFSTMRPIGAALRSAPMPASTSLSARWISASSSGPLLWPPRAARRAVKMPSISASAGLSGWGRSWAR